MANEFNVDEQYGSGASYLRAADLQNRRVAVTIAAVDLEQNFDKTGKVIVLSFAGKEKKFALNATNARMIKDLFNEPDARNWVGRTISLRPDKTQNPQGLTVDCIRVDFELPEQVSFTPPVNQPVQHTQTLTVEAGDIPF